jgi:hypothetical protein
MQQTTFRVGAVSVLTRKVPGKSPGLPEAKTAAPPTPRGKFCRRAADAGNLVSRRARALVAALQQRRAEAVAAP